jgi:radical SAM protein with 4Fe4S-binding SPASM domain
MGSFSTNFRILKGLIKALSIRRMINLGWLYLSHIISIVIRRPVLAGLPWSLTIEPTNACNLSCPECPTGTKGLTRIKGSINTEFFTGILEQTKKHAFFLNLYFQGEPFLNKNIIDLIKIAKQHRFFTSCSTNAHFINEQTAGQIISSGLDHLIISLDGTTQDVYEKYRAGGNFELVKRAISMLVKEKKDQKRKYPVIDLQYLVMKHNEHQMQEAKELARFSGVDRIVFKSLQTYHPDDGKGLIPDNQKYSRYKKTAGGLKLRKPIRNRCLKSWTSCVITWDGKVVPCCFDKDAVYCYGDLQKNSLKDIIYGIKSREFRRQILTDRKKTDICLNCSE